MFWKQDISSRAIPISENSLKRKDQLPNNKHRQQSRLLSKEVNDIPKRSSHQHTINIAAKGATTFFLEEHPKIGNDKAINSKQMTFHIIQQQTPDCQPEYDGQNEVRLYLLPTHDMKQNILYGFLWFWDVLFFKPTFPCIENSCNGKFLFCFLTRADISPQRKGGVYARVIYTFHYVGVPYRHARF